MVTKDETRVAEAHSSLDRLKAEGGAFDSAMPSDPKRERDSKNSAPSEDTIERWGRIIGRTLGWAAALFFAWQFLSSFGA